MSEQLKPWNIGDRIAAPCGHAEPQAATQLHGVCIFCWRDRCGALERNRRAIDPSALVAALEKDRDSYKFSSASPSTAAHTAGYVQGLTKAIEIVKENVK